MKEAKELCALIEDVDPQTFARFGQYIYSGTYHAAEHHVLLDADAIGKDAITRDTNEDSRDAAIEDSLVPREEGVVEPEDPWGSFAVTSTKKKRRFGKKGFISTGGAQPSPPPPEIEEPPYAKSSTHHPSPDSNSRDQRSWEEFTALQYHTDSRNEVAEVRANTEPCEEYTEIFLSHARMYTLADKYSVGSLRQLALQRLHETLVRFTLYDERIPDIICLLSFSYDNTPDRIGSVDELCQLVVKFVCCHIARIHSDARFVDMMKAQGPLSVDVLQELMEKLE